MKNLVLALCAMAALGACADGVAPTGSARLAPLLQPSGTLTTAVVPGEYIVVLNERTPDVTAAANEAARHGARVSERWDAAINGFVMRGDAEALRKVREDARVKFVEPNLRVSVDAVSSWGLDRVDQVVLPLNLTYSAPNTGAGVHIYIIDTGVYTAHNEFTGRIGNGYDAVTAGGTGNDTCHGHGTHVAGTAAGTNYGVAKKAIIHPVRVLDCTGNGTDAGVVAGINWVAKNRIAPAVANMSIGGPSSSAITLATTNLINAGVTTAVSAGNSRTDACTQSPANTPTAITVGATNNLDAHASFSNFGPCVDIYAPGANIVSAWNWSSIANTTASGTSMASPHVAGAAALYLSANPGATPATVGSALVALAASRVTGVPANTTNKLLQVQGIAAGTAPTTPPPTSPPPPPSNVAPVAQFSVTCTKVPSPSKCVLDANASTDDAGKSNLTFTWTNTAGRPAKTGIVATYYVAVSGYANTFNVTLTATDKQGLKSSITKLVAIP